MRVCEILHVGKEEREDRGCVAEGDTDQDLLVSFPASTRACCASEVEETHAGDVLGEEVRGVGVERGLGVGCGGDEARDGIEDDEAEQEQGVADDRAL